MKRIIYIVPAILYYALIFYVSSQSPRMKVSFPLIDKGAHILEFAILAFLLSFGIFHLIKSSLKVKMLIVVMSGILLGVMDEIHQYFVPLRQFDYLDIIADGIGILIGFLAYFLMSRRLNLRGI